MSLIGRAKWFSLAIAVILLAAGYALAGIWPGFLAALVLGAIGWFRPRPIRAYTGTVLFFALLGQAALGVLSQVSDPAMLFVSLAALAYWDLDAFVTRLQRVNRGPLTSKLEQVHLVRLLMILGIGLGIGLVGLTVRLQLGLGTAMLLSLIVILGIRFGVMVLQEKGSPD
jgi:hypothetical protein